MKEEKKESPIGVLWGWGKPYHGKFIGIIALCGYFGKVLFSCLSTTISHTATYYTLRDL